MPSFLRSILASEGVLPDSSSKTASSFNPASPFAKKLEDLLTELMQPGSRISVGSGKGEFSGKFGMRVTVVNPIEFEPTPFTSDNVEDEDEHKTKEFLVLLGKLEARLSQWFGLIAHTETTEESAITFTLELRGPN